MVCPKCGAQVDANATACPYCNEALENTAPAAPAEGEKPEKTKKLDLKNVDWKSKKTWFCLAAGAAALVLVILLICGIVNLFKNPQTTAENYVEAFLDGDLKGALKETAPWVIRDMSIELDMDETSSASKVAKEYEEYEDFEKTDGKIKIVRSEVLSWCDNEYDNASASVFNNSSGMSFSEAKDIEEYARVRVYYTVTQKGEDPVDRSMTVNLVKLGSSWYVLDEID